MQDKLTQPETAPADVATQLNADVQTVDLEYPIKRANGEITRVTIRRPKAGALRGTNLMALANIDVEALRVVVPRISDPILSAVEINEMELRDLMSLAAAISVFFLSRAEREQIAKEHIASQTT